MAPGRQPADREPGERRVDQPPLAVPGLGPRVREERPQLGQPSWGDEVLERPDRVDTDQAHVVGADLGQPPQRVGHPGPPDLEGQHVVRRPAGGQRGGGLADARADLHDQRRLPAEPPREREPRLVDGRVRDHPLLVVGRPRRGLVRGEAVAAAGVAEHLPHPAAVLGQLVVRAGGGDSLVHPPRSRQRVECLGEDLGVPVHVGLGVRRAEQRHVVERRQQHPAVEAPQVQEPLELLVHGGRRGGAVGRWRAEPVLRAAAQPLHVPGQAVRLDRPGDARGEPLGQGHGDREVLVAQRRGERGPDRAQRERTAGERAADAGDVDLVAQHRPGELPGDLGRHAVRRAGDAAADRLADHEQVRLQSPRRRAATGAGAHRVRLVDHQQHAVPAGDLADRRRVAVGGQHDADVGQRRFHEQARDVALGQPLVQRLEVVERDHRRGGGDVGLRTEGAGARHDGSGVVEHGEGLVDGAVVAPVHHRDPGPAGEMPGEAEHEPVRVGRGDGELPERQPEPAAQLGADPGRIRRRQHRGRPGGDPGGHRLGHRRQRVAGHRPGVAQAQVDVLQPVDVDEPTALRRVDRDRERPGPPRHPRHRDTGQQAAALLLGERGRARVLGDEPGLFVLAEAGQPSTVDHVGSLERAGPGGGRMSP